MPNTSEIRTSQVSVDKKYSFFSQMQRQEVSKSQTSFAWKPCGTVYLALAVAICDDVLSSPFSASQTGMNKLLQAYFKRYPVFNAASSGTVWTDFKALILSEKVAAVCTQLAETLHALTLEGLYENVTRYHEHALPQERRHDRKQWVAKSAPSVIADVLGFSIRLSLIASGRPLHASTYYDKEGGYKKIIDIRERHGQYYAKIGNSNVFERVLPATAPPQEDEAFYAKLDARIETEIDSSLLKFREFYKTAVTMLDAGELSKSFLIDLYINHLCTHRLHGTQAFFDSIHLEEADHQVHMMLELLDAFARGVALGDFNKKIFYDSLQQSEEMSHEPRSAIACR